MSEVVFYLVLTVILWGIAPIFDKGALRSGSPLAGVFLRSMVIGVVMTLIALFSGRIKDVFSVPAKSAIFFSVSALLAGCLGVFTYYRALQLAPSSKIVPLAASYPLITAILSMLFLNEQVSVLRLLGILLIVSGIILVQ